MKTKLIRKPDIIIIAVLLIIAAACFFAVRGSGDAVAVITVDGKTVKTVDLSSTENETVILDTSPAVTLIIEDGTIRFSDALCPDKTCEKSGRLSSPGDTAACLPAKTVVTVEGKREGAPDAYSY